MSDNLMEIIEVYSCLLNRSKNRRIAFNGLSKEAQKIITESGFDLYSVKIKTLSKGNPEFREYRKKVNKLTEKVAHLIPGVENRGFTKKHIDHKISIWDGWNKGFPAESIADISNLEMLPYRDNMVKGIKSKQ